MPSTGKGVLVISAIGADEEVGTIKAIAALAGFAHAGVTFRVSTLEEAVADVQALLPPPSSSANAAAPPPERATLRAESTAR